MARFLATSLLGVLNKLIKPTSSDLRVAGGFNQVGSQVAGLGFSNIRVVNKISLEQPNLTDIYTYTYFYMWLLINGCMDFLLLFTFQILILFSLFLSPKPSPFLNPHNLSINDSCQISDFPNEGL